MVGRVTVFREEHLTAAAALLAARQRADRRRQPLLSKHWEQPDMARSYLARLLEQPDSHGFIVEDGDGVQAYLAGQMVLPSPLSVRSLLMRPRSGQIPLGGYAARPAVAYEGYRRLYAALGERWNAAGCFSHYVDVTAVDATAREAWFSLGFGEDDAVAIRATGPVDRTPRAGSSAVSFRRAGPADIETVMHLSVQLARFHQASPVYYPYPVEVEPDLRRHMERQLAEPSCALWLAVADEAVVGMQTFSPASFDPLLVPERSVSLDQAVTLPQVRGRGAGSALLAHTMGWANDTGFHYCLLSYLTANLKGAAFWSGHGFQPLSYRMLRQVDERIAWANGRTNENAAR